MVFYTKHSQQPALRDYHPQGKQNSEELRDWLRVTVHESWDSKLGMSRASGLEESLWEGTVPDDLLGPQMAPTMSLQVIGPPSTGSKVVLWAESRLPRQTWSISESGHICSEMFEGLILDVKGKGACVREKAPEAAAGRGVLSDL